MALLLKLRQGAIPWIVASVGLAGAVVAFSHLSRVENTRIAEEFRQHSQGFAADLEQNMRMCDETLRTLRDLYHYSDEVTRVEFSLATADLTARHPAVFAFFWAPRVEGSQRKDFETKTRENTQSDFDIYPALPAGAAQSEPAFPVLYVMPYGIAHIEGYDLSRSAPWRVFEQTAREGAPRLIGRPAFLPAEIADVSTLLIAPVYLNCVPGNEAERVSRLRGFLLALVNPTVLLEQTATQNLNHGLEVQLWEDRDSSAPRLLYSLASSHGQDGIFQRTNDLHATVHLGLDGADWSLEFRPSPTWLASQQSLRAHITAFLIALLSVALAFYLAVLSRRADEIERLVAERTSALTQAQAKLQEDLLHRMEIERALKTSEDRYRMLVRLSSDSIGRLELTTPVRVDADPEFQVQQILAHARVAECNEAAARCYRAKDPQALVGKGLVDLGIGSSERQRRVITAFVKSQYRLTDYEFSDTGASDRVFLHSLFGAVEKGNLVRIWIIERELTEQRRIELERQNFERRLADAQRLESLGVLAGGIAHDFNNLLTGILGHASLGRIEVTADSPLQEHFEQIELASRSAANLCQQMLAYAGKGRFVVKPESLSGIVANSKPLLQASISKNAEVRLELDDAIPPVLADATQIQQIIMNLVVNASEAFDERGGVITISTGRAKASEASFEGCVIAPRNLGASYAFLQVSDTGPGMSPEVLGRIFEPFFTTKFAGRGLGLAATLGIVRRHDGALRVESEKGHGTRFTLYLQEAAQTAQAEGGNHGADSPLTAHGTLLVVDDEAPVRNVAERIARAIGFDVVAAADGLDGLKLYEQRSKDIAVVLLDLSMPGLCGDDLVARFRKMPSEPAIVLMSGYSQPFVPSDLGSGLPVFLQKPFNILQFQAAVSQAVAKRMKRAPVGI